MYTNTRMCVYVHIHMYIYTQTSYTHIYMYIWVYINAYMYTYVYIYIHIYTCIYIYYIYVYVHMYLHLFISVYLTWAPGHYRVTCASLTGASVGCSPGAPGPLRDAGGPRSTRPQGSEEHGQLQLCQGSLWSCLEVGLGWVSGMFKLL